jgi:hypothetical protein
MSVSTEVQRTLVKSPPELWTELSNPEALARHLGDFGEIRITKTEPETKVEWEANETSGFVQLKQSGWGTKVTLSVTRTPAIPEQPPAPEPAVVAETEPEPAAAAEPQPAVIVEPEPVAVEPEPVIVEPEPVAVEPEPVIVEPEPVTVEPEPQPGFFARLFRKRKMKHIPVVEPEPETEIEIEVVALAAPEPIYPDPSTQPEALEPAEDLATELESLEAQMAAETTELLTSVLDRLGAAHHRPFSRG